MVCRDRFVGVHHGRKTPGEERHFLENVGGDGGAGEAGDVFETCFGPVVDYEEGEESGADGVKPPEVELMAYQWEEEGKRVEDDVGFAVWGSLVENTETLRMEGTEKGGVCTLRQCLNLGGFDADASKPDNALYYNRSSQGSNRHGR